MLPIIVRSLLFSLAVVLLLGGALHWYASRQAGEKNAIGVAVWTALFLICFFVALAVQQLPASSQPWAAATLLVIYVGLIAWGVYQMHRFG